MKNSKPNVHIRLTDKQLWARIRAQAALESVPVGIIVERALVAFMSKHGGPLNALAGVKKRDAVVRTGAELTAATSNQQR